MLLKYLIELKQRKVRISRTVQLLETCLLLKNWKIIFLGIFRFSKILFQVIPSFLFRETFLDFFPTNSFFRYVQLQQVLRVIRDPGLWPGSLLTGKLTKVSPKLLSYCVNPVSVAHSLRRPFFNSFQISSVWIDLQVVVGCHRLDFWLKGKVILPPGSYLG